MTTSRPTNTPDSELAKRLADEIERKTHKTPEEIYDERERRLTDAVELREPDRVPVVIKPTYFAARYTGLQMATAFYDAAAWKEAVKKTIVELEPDFYRTSGMMQASSGLAFGALDPIHMRWPGGNLPPDVIYQYVDAEYMKGDEYDLFLADPSDYVLRYYLPRVYGALKPLSKLPPIRNLTGTSLPSMVHLFASPEFMQVAHALHQAGQEQLQWRQVMNSFDEEMAALGFPPFWRGGGAGGVGGGAPFDIMADSLRGMRGTMLDMYQRPQKLLALCDKLQELRMARATPAPAPKRGKPNRVYVTVHWGGDNVMSPKQFETFYWPGLKKAMEHTIALGYVPVLNAEARFEDRLEYLLDLPKGKFIAFLYDVDMAKAKQILGNHCCIMGNVPATLLEIGSVDEVNVYCKNLIEVCGKDGGFVLTNRGSLDEAKPANVKAMVDSVKKYHAG